MTWKEPKARSYSREVFAPKSNHRSLNSVISWVVIRFHVNVWRGKMILQRFTWFPHGGISFCHEWKVACALSFPQYCDIFPQFRNFEPQCLWGFMVVYCIFYLLMCWSFQNLSWPRVDSIKNGRSLQFGLLLSPPKKLPWFQLILAAKLQQLLFWLSEGFVPQGVLFCILFPFSVISWGSFHYMTPLSVSVPSLRL